MAGGAAAAGDTVEAFTAGPASSADVGSSADEALRVAQWADSTAEAGSTAPQLVGLTVAEGSMVEAAASTVAADTAAADTGNRSPIRGSPTP